VAVLTGQAHPGAQYSGKPPEAFRNAADPGHVSEARAAFSRLANLPIRVFCNTTVWGAFAGGDRSSPAFELTILGPEGPRRLVCATLILATGGYDRPIPFPGWTLPGVMTAGGIQALLKGQQVLAGRRVLLAGSGPLQLAVAAGLVRAGADVVSVLEATRPGLDYLRQAPAAWGQWSRLSEGWGYLRALAHTRVPLLAGWGIVAAHAGSDNGRVAEATIAQLDDEWRPVAGSERTLAVDTIGIGYGLLASAQLGRLLGCAHDYRPEEGGWVPRRDRAMATSLPGLYAAGDGAGIGGAQLAHVEGRIAGLAAARQLGRLPENQFRVAMRKEAAALSGEQRFARLLGALFAPRPGLYELAGEDTVICRCEEVTLGDIRRVVAGGARGINEVKGLTRSGMGNCQGRICEDLVARVVAAAARGGTDAQAVQSAGTFTARSPLYPLPLETLAQYAD
jgi:D-hydroxyproline dehydrogenase subunit alpha